MTHDYTTRVLTTATSKKIKRPQRAMDRKIAVHQTKRPGVMHRIKKKEHGWIILQNLDSPKKGNEQDTQQEI